MSASSRREQQFIEWWKKTKHGEPSGALFKIYTGLHAKGIGFKDLEFLGFLKEFLRDLDVVVSRLFSASTRRVEGYSNEQTPVPDSGGVVLVAHGLAGILSLTSACEDWLGERTTSKTRKTRIVESLGLAKLDPCVIVALKFVLLDTDHKTGARPDRRGTLILLTLVDFFRISIKPNRGQRRRSLWYEAGMLLNLFRDKTVQDFRAKRRRALAKRTRRRVQLLMEFLPGESTWLGDARVLIMEYYKNHYRKPEP